MSSAPTSGCPMHALSGSYNPFEKPQLDDPIPVWHQARTEAPVFFSERVNAWVVSRYADVIDVLRRWQVFGPGVERKMFAEPSPEADALLAGLPRLEDTKIHNSEPPQHTKLRRYIQPALVPNRVAPMEPALRQLAEDLVGKLDGRTSGEFYEDFAFPYPMNVISHLIAIPTQDFERIKDWTDQQVQLRYGTPSAAEQLALAQSQVELFEYTVALVRQRRANLGDDLLSSMILDSDASDDPLNDEQLAAQVTTMITAGHETTAHFLTMLMHRVLSNPELWQLLVAAPQDSAAIIEEAFRTGGPVQSVWRRAKEDTRIGGVQIPAGARISILLGSANLDEEAFDDAEEFRLGRPNVGSHVAFGRGIHTCPGSGVARTEIRLALEVLATRLPKLRLADDPGYLFKPGATQRMAERLYLVWD